MCASILVFHMFSTRFVIQFHSSKNSKYLVVIEAGFGWKSDVDFGGFPLPMMLSIIPHHREFQ